MQAAEPKPSSVTEYEALQSLLRKWVKVFLSARNIVLRGRLAGFDENAVILNDDVGSTIVYKDQIISVTEDCE